MSPAAIATDAVALVALLAAAVNLWIFWLRREDRGHLWLGVAALGVSVTALPTAFAYEATSGAEAIALRRLVSLGLVVHMVGFLRFSEGLLGVGLRNLERVTIAALVFLLAFSFVPGLTFTGNGVVRDVLGARFVDAEVTTFGAMILSAFVAVTIRLLWLFHRHAPRDDRTRGVPAAAALWLVCALTDIASGAGVLHLPAFFPLGQLGFVVAFTGTRIRHFVGAMTKAEARAVLLERLAAEQTQALRQKELQLARGEPFAAAGTLAASLAHEINNPVAFVFANLNHLQALRKERADDAEVEEVLLETQEGVARLGAIVESLLRLANSDRRRNDAVDLEQVVTSALPLVRNEAGPDVRVEMALGPAPLVSGDPGQLGQVVLNLLQNALHSLSAAKCGGRVLVSLRTQAGRAELSVEDDGPGIAPGDVPRVFEPFFTTKPQGQGTGLGLAVTREIVARHGGTIDVQSGAHGTRFRVSLPGRSVQATSSPARTS